MYKSLSGYISLITLNIGGFVISKIFKMAPVIPILQYTCH